MRGSPLKLNIKFGWRFGCGTEEPWQQVEAFEEKLIFFVIISYFLQMASCVGNDGTPAQRSEPARTEHPAWVSRALGLCLDGDDVDPVAAGPWADLAGFWVGDLTRVRFLWGRRLLVGFPFANTDLGVGVVSWDISW